MASAKCAGNHRTPAWLECHRIMPSVPSHAISFYVGPRRCEQCLSPLLYILPQRMPPMWRAASLTGGNWWSSVIACRTLLDHRP